MWLDPDGRVLAVLANVPPCGIEPCPLYEPDATAGSVAVLEIRAGGAARHQITAGCVATLLDSPAIDALSGCREELRKSRTGLTSSRYRVFAAH